MSRTALLSSTIPDTSTIQLSDPAVEAVHLRRLIERQPSCLVRVGIDGLLLAANEAALRLLGTEELGHVLGRTLTEQIAPDHRERWHDFVARLRDSASGSMECDLVDLAGIQRTVFLEGVAQADHPDGIESMILAVRDTSGTGRLEQALQEHEATRQALADVRTELEQALAERQRLETLLEEHEGHQQRLMTEHAAERAQVQALAEEQQLSLLVKEREERQRLDNLQEQLEQALAEQRHLGTLLEERDAAEQRLVAEHAAERAQVQALAEEQQLSLLVKEREGRQLLHNLQTKLQQALAEQQRLEILLEEQETHRQKVAEKQAADYAEAERALAAATLEREQLLKALARAASLAGQIVQVNAETPGLGIQPTS